MDPDAYASWLTSLVEVAGRPPRVLTWSTTADLGLIVLSPAALSVRTPDRPPGEDWRHVGWHEIERGGWNTETEQLRWQTYSGTRGATALPDPGQVPAVFKERVAASIVFEHFVPVAAGSDRGVIVNARRDLAAGDTAIDWRVTLTRGVTWRTPGVRELADAALAELRQEYDEG